MDAPTVSRTHLLAHSKIDRLFTVLREALEAGDPAHERIFLGLRADIASHFASEERIALPRYAEAFPEEAAIIRREHEQIRAELSSLATKAAESSLSLRDVSELRVKFSLHESREETTLYPWFAEKELATSPSP